MHDTTSQIATICVKNLKNIIVKIQPAQSQFDNSNIILTRLNPLLFVWNCMGYRSNLWGKEDLSRPSLKKQCNSAGSTRIVGDKRLDTIRFEFIYINIYIGIYVMYTQIYMYIYICIYICICPYIDQALLVGQPHPLDVEDNEKTLVEGWRVDPQHVPHRPMAICSNVWHISRYVLGPSYRWRFLTPMPRDTLLGRRNTCWRRARM